MPVLPPALRCTLDNWRGNLIVLIVFVHPSIPTCLSLHWQNATAEPTSNPTVAELTKVPELTKVGEVLIKRAKLINSVLAETHLYRNSMGGWYDDTGKFRWQSHTSKIVKDGYKALPLDIRYGMFGDKDYQTKPLHSGCENLLKMLGVCTLYILVQREWFWFREKWWGRDRINYASKTLEHWVVKFKSKGKLYVLTAHCTYTHRNRNTHTHTHIHIHTYIHTYIQKWNCKLFFGFIFSCHLTAQ